MTATIHVDDAASNVGCSHQQEEQGLLHILKNLRVHCPLRRRENGTERKAVDGDARGEGDCKRFCQGGQGSLTDGVGEMICTRAQGSPVEQIDDMTTSVWRELTSEGLAEQEGGSQIDGEMTLPIR